MTFVCSTYNRKIFQSHAIELKAVSRRISKIITKYFIHLDQFAAFSLITFLPKSRLSPREINLNVLSHNFVCWESFWWVSEFRTLWKFYWNVWDQLQLKVPTTMKKCSHNSPEWNSLLPSSALNLLLSFKPSRAPVNNQMKTSKKINK